MCLSYISRIFEESENIQRDGFKIFVRDSKGKIELPFQGINRPLFLDQWIHENRYNEGSIAEIEAIDGEVYPSGFHIFETAEDAKNFAESSLSCNTRYTVSPVKARKVVVEGIQFAAEEVYNIFVAKEIMILKEVVYEG